MGKRMGWARFGSVERTKHKKQIQNASGFSFGLDCVPCHHVTGTKCTTVELALNRHAWLAWNGILAHKHVLFSSCSPWPSIATWSPGQLHGVRHGGISPVSHSLVAGGSHASFMCVLVTRANETCCTTFLLLIKFLTGVGMVIFSFCTIQVTFNVMCSWCRPYSSLPYLFCC